MAAAVANLTLIANATDPMRAFVSIFVVLAFVVSL
jgi:hypothetical protein